MPIIREITAKGIMEWLLKHRLCYVSQHSKGGGYKYLDVQLGNPPTFTVYTTDASDAGSRELKYSGTDVYKAVGVYNEV